MNGKTDQERQKTMYRYDLHVHTSEVSPCGHLDVREMVRRYEEKGYSGIWLTNHFHREFEEMTEGMSWREKADFFLGPYREGKKLAGGRMTVDLGWRSGSCRIPMTICCMD